MGTSAQYVKEVRGRIFSDMLYNILPEHLKKYAFYYHLQLYEDLEIHFYSTSNVLVSRMESHIAQLPALQSHGLCFFQQFCSHQPVALRARHQLHQKSMQTLLTLEELHEYP